MSAHPPKLRLDPDRIAVTIDTRTPEAGNGGVVPPKETRRQPGESGNPNGAATSLDRILEQELERLVGGDASLDD